MYYAFIQNNKINGCGQCKCLNEDIQNIEISEEQFNEIDKYIYQNGEIILDPDYERQQLEKAKQDKNKEALEKAQDYIANTGCYEFEEGKSIEINDGNIAKLTAYTVAMGQGLYDEIVWVTKEDKVVTLKLEDILNILQGIAKEQSRVWVEKYPHYLLLVDEAETIEDVEAIVIDYAIGEYNGN